MAHYRLYFLDSNDHIIRAVDLDAEDEAAAFESLKEHEGAGRLELWLGTKCVARRQASTNAASSGLWRGASRGPGR